MPQIDFIATWEDSLRLLETISQMPGIRLIPDLRYQTEEPIIVCGPDVVRTTFKSPTRIYIWSVEVSPLRPPLSKITDGKNAGKFWLCPADENLLLDFSASDIRVASGIKKLSPGMISWKRIRNHPRNAASSSKPREELIGDIRAIIKTQMTRMTLHEATWVGQNALAEFKHGELVLLDCGREFSVNSTGQLVVSIPAALKE